MVRPEDSLLGREVSYPRRYDPSLLFPIPRAAGRAALALEGAPPFIGHDRWHAYELSWLDHCGRPQVAPATFLVPASTPHLVESKSLKLYLNSLNATRFDDAGAVRMQIAADLSQAAGGDVEVAFGLPPFEAGEDGATCISGPEGAIDRFRPPDAPPPQPRPATATAEILRSELLKSNCPVTGQPDWATIDIAYRGPRIDHAALLRYLVSFRDHAGFHEQCVEQVFTDLMARCQPQMLSVEARYTRRGGLDINPWRATPGTPPPPQRRDLRQ